MTFTSHKMKSINALHSRNKINQNFCDVSEDTGLQAEALNETNQINDLKMVNEHPTHPQGR